MWGCCWDGFLCSPVQLPLLDSLRFVLGRGNTTGVCTALAGSSVSCFRGRRQARCWVLRRAHGRSTTFPWVLPRPVLRGYGLTLRGAVGECSRCLRVAATVVGVVEVYSGFCGGLIGWSNRRTAARKSINASSTRSAAIRSSINRSTIDRFDNGSELINTDPFDLRRDKRPIQIR